MAANLELAQELNILGNNCWACEIHELPTVSLFMQEFSVPGCSLSGAMVPNSNIDYNVPGEKIEFEHVTITFMVDENLKNYLEVFNWMNALGFPESSDQYKDLKEGRTPYTETSDLSIITTTNKFMSNLELIFVNSWPTDLSGFDFTNVDTTITPIQCTVTFDYSYYFFRSINS